MNEKEFAKMWEENVSCDECPFRAVCSDTHYNCECSTFIPNMFYKMRNHLYDSPMNWVNYMFSEAVRDGDIGIMYDDDDRGVVIVYNKKDPFEHGMAVCGKYDMYDRETGIAIAYARYLDMDIHPYFESKRDRERE